MTGQRNRLETPDGLKHKIVEAARDLRKNPTRSEALLWQALRNKQLNGIKFRRQQPIGSFIVDFYAPAIRLIVEVDGSVHEGQQEVDQARQMILEDLDFRVLRFSASQVEKDLESVLSIIRTITQEIQGGFTSFDPTPSPSPLVGEGGKEPRGRFSPRSQLGSGAGGEGVSEGEHKGEGNHE